MRKTLQRKLFHLCAQRSYSRRPDWRESRFKESFAETKRFFSRLGNLVDIQGHTFLDYGCGMGATCIYLSLHGAKHATGVEIDADAIRFAKDNLRSGYPQLRHCTSFKLVEELADETFDCVVSKACFEHYQDPGGTLEEMGQRIKETGRIYLGFSPFWKSPYGGHINYVTRLPWAHIIFPEEIILAERERLTGKKASSFEEIGLNRMTVKRFREILNDSGLEAIYLVFNQSEHLAMKVFDLLACLPFCREYFTVNAYAILKKGSV